jgi:hypothetical protein
MARWLVGYYPHLEFDWACPGAEFEIPCFRIYPEDEPDRWVIETNGSLSREMQEETALLIADLLSTFLGV